MPREFGGRGDSGYFGNLEDSGDFGGRLTSDAGPEKFADEAAEEALDAYMRREIGGGRP